MPPGSGVNPSSSITARIRSRVCALTTVLAVQGARRRRDADARTTRHVPDRYGLLRHGTLSWNRLHETGYKRYQRRQGVVGISRQTLESLETTRIYLSAVLPRASEAAIDAIHLNLH